MSAGLPTLAGRGIVLRQLTEEDAVHFLGVYSDPRVMRYWSRGPFQDKDEALAALARIECGWRDDVFYQWGIVPVGEEQVIGTATLFRIERDHRRAEVGFAIGSAWWGRGLGTATVSRLTEYAFGQLALGRLEADVDPRNFASLRVLEKLGFRREGLLRERYHVGGEVQDSVILGLLKRDWPGR